MVPEDVTPFSGANMVNFVDEVVDRPDAGKIYPWFDQAIMWYKAQGYARG